MASWKWKCTLISALAWLASHLTLHMIGEFIGTKPYGGPVAVINAAVSLAAYFIAKRYWFKPVM